jgi:hypothetical protein
MICAKGGAASRSAALPAPAHDGLTIENREAQDFLIQWHELKAGRAQHEGYCT